MDENKISKILRISLFCLLILVIILFFILVRSILFPFFLGAAFAYLINPFVKYIEKKDIKRSMAIFISFLVVLVIVTIISLVVIPVIINEFTHLDEYMVKLTAQLRMFTHIFAKTYHKFSLIQGLQHFADILLQRIQAAFRMFLQRSVDTGLKLMSSMFSIVIAPILTYYFLRDWECIGQKILKIVPGNLQKEFVHLASEIDTTLSGFIRGQLLVSSIVGIFAAIGLSILGVQFAFIIGLIIGITDLVPFLGAVVGALPAVTVALAKSPFLALKALILIALLQQIEGNILSPKIVGENVGLHPLLVIFSLMAGGELFGIFGMLIAVPTAATLKVLFNYLIKYILC